MSNLKLQNLSKSETTSFLTAEETSLVLGGISFSRLDFFKSFFDDVTFENINNTKKSSSKKSSFKKFNSKTGKEGKKKLDAGNIKADNVILGTSGPDLLTAD